MIKTTTTTFLKISGISFRETSNDGEKLYALTVDCDIFSDFDKEVKIWTITKVFSDIKEEDLSIRGAYLLLMPTFNQSEEV